MSDDLKTIRSIKDLNDVNAIKVRDYLRKANPPEPGSILEQDTARDTKPADHDTIAEDSITDFDPKPPILED